MKQKKKQWKTPSLIEIPVTMEVAAYRCAQLGES